MVHSIYRRQSFIDHHVDPNKLSQKNKKKTYYSVICLLYSIFNKRQADLLFAWKTEYNLLLRRSNTRWILSGAIMWPHNNYIGLPYIDQTKINYNNQLYKYI